MREKHSNNRKNSNRLGKIRKQSYWRRGLLVAGICGYIGLAVNAKEFLIDNAKAATISIRTENAVVEKTGADVKIYLDGELQKDGKTKGIMLDDVCMVPLEEIFEKQLKVEYNYDHEKNEIQLEANGVKLVLEPGKDIVDINGERRRMEKAPFWQVDSIGEHLYVPVKFIAEGLNFGCLEIEKDAIELLTPVRVKKEEGYSYLTGSKIEKIVYNNQTISLQNTVPGIIYNSTAYIPLHSLEKTPVRANIDETEEYVTLEHQGNEIMFYKDGSMIVADGVALEIANPLFDVEYKNKKDYLVPAKLVFEAFGASNISISSEKKKIIVTQKEDSQLNINTQPNNKKGNYLKKILVKKKSKTDVLTFQCNKTPKIKVKSNKKQITLTIKNVSINKNYSEKGFLAKYTQSLNVKKSGKNVICIIKKKSGKKFICQYGSGKIRIIIGAAPVKIAVDCGHGSNTPGKRSPKMPCDIDFEGDGIIDVKKGQCIREHQGNVGVGKFLAKELERCGFSVYRSAFGSADISLTGRQKNIKANKCKYSISVHFNAAGTGMKFHKASGVEVFYHRNATKAKKSSKMAKIVLKQMARGTKQINRGVKTMELAMCNAKTMGTQGSILVECAFMTNLHEAKTMFGNQGYWKETAKEIAKAMCEYNGVEYVEA